MTLTFLVFVEYLTVNFLFFRYGPLLSDFSYFISVEAFNNKLDANGDLQVRIKTQESQCHLVLGVAKDPLDLYNLLGRLSRMIGNLIGPLPLV